MPGLDLSDHPMALGVSPRSGLPRKLSHTNNAWGASMFTYPSNYYISITFTPLILKVIRSQGRTTHLVSQIYGYFI